MDLSPWIFIAIGALPGLFIGLVWGYRLGYRDGAKEGSKVSREAAIESMRGVLRERNAKWQDSEGDWRSV